MTVVCADRGVEVGGEVLGGADEPAEEDRGVPVVEQRLGDRDRLGQLGVRRRAGHLLEPVSQREEGRAVVVIDLRAGFDVVGIGGVEVGIGDLQPADLVDDGQVGVVGDLDGAGPFAERRGAGGRRRAERADQAEHRPPPHPLLAGVAGGAGSLEAWSGPVHHLDDQGVQLARGPPAAVRVGEVEPGRERGGAEVVGNVDAFAGDEVAGEQGPLVRGQIGFGVGAGQPRVQQPDQASGTRPLCRSAGWR